MITKPLIKYSDLIVFGFIILLCLGLAWTSVIMREEREVKLSHPKIVNVKGCDYILIEGGMLSHETYTHLSNCSNPIHKNL